MELLLVHQSYPGQFKHLEQALLGRGDRLTALGKQPIKARRAGVDAIGWKPTRGNSADVSPLLHDLESKVLRAEWAANVAEQRRREGYRPDLILAHPGWGEALFLKDVWPDVPQLHYLEFDYQIGVDMGFDPEFPDTDSWRCRARQRMKSANTLLNLHTMSWGITPTQFQCSTLPARYRQQVSVIHDGINHQQLRPDPQARLRLADGRVLGSLLVGSDPVLTFVNRTFEPYRGVHRLLRALPELQQRLPHLQVLLIGRDSAKVSYGANRTDGQGWLSALRRELDGQLDWSRIHAPGHLPYDQFVAAMQLSAAHVYFTYPFVLSWSLLEAMSCGALVIGSATSPVQEVIQHGKNGILVDFFDQQALVESVVQAVAKPRQHLELRQEARRTVKRHYSLDECCKRQMQLIDAVASRLIGVTT